MAEKKYLDENGLLYYHQKAKATFVAQESGKGLSTNDYTTAEKNKLSGIEAGAEVNDIDTIKVNGAIQTITSKAVDITVPTNNNQLTNGAGYQNATEVQTAINSAISGITGITFEVVQSLPATGENGVIYLLSNSGTSPNIYDEYIWLSDSSSFEKIGTTDIDLSNYATKTEVEALIPVVYSSSASTSSGVTTIVTQNTALTSLASGQKIILDDMGSLITNKDTDDKLRIQVKLADGTGQAYPIYATVDWDGSEQQLTVEGARGHKSVMLWFSSNKWYFVGKNSYSYEEINNMISHFAYESTTLAGYGITDAYTKTEVDGMISQAGEENVIETVKVNGTALTPDANKAVNVTVPTKVSDLTNDSGYTTNTGTITGVSANGTSVATSGVANIPAASTSAYGVTKLSSSTSSTSTTLAATPSAVKAAYDLANGKQSPATTLAGYGITDAYTKTTTDSTFQKSAELVAITNSEIDTIVAS